MRFGLPPIAVFSLTNLVAFGESLITPQHTTIWYRPCVNSGNWPLSVLKKLDSILLMFSLTFQSLSLPSQGVYSTGIHEKRPKAVQSSWSSEVTQSSQNDLFQSSKMYSDQMKNLHFHHQCLTQHRNYQVPLCSVDYFGTDCTSNGCLYVAICCHVSFICFFLFLPSFFKVSLF